MNDLCPSCVWEPSTEDDEMLEFKEEVLHAALATVRGDSMQV